MKKNGCFKNKGQVMVEYAFVLLLIIFCLFAMRTTIGNFINQFFFGKYKDMAGGASYNPATSTGQIAEETHSAWTENAFGHGGLDKTYTNNMSQSNVNVETPTQ